jgi:hypothetical protein
MNKADAVAFLVSIDFANGNKAVQAALEAAADKRGLTEKPAPKAKAKPAAKKKTTVADTVMKEAKAKSKTGSVTIKAPKVPVQTQAEAIAALTKEVGEALM